MEPLSLDALARDPARAAALTPEQRAALIAQVIVLLAALIAPSGAPNGPPPPAPERALRVAEAAERLGMSKDYVHRHWRKLGGFKDDDGRLKFPLSVIERHLRRGRR